MDISIKEVLKDFLIYISKERNFSNHTVSAYDRDLKKFINYIKEMHHESFDDFHLISALHSYHSIKDENYNNILPPLTLLSEEKQKELIEKLNKLKFTSEKNLAA